MLSERLVEMSKVMDLAVSGTFYVDRAWWFRDSRTVKRYGKKLKARALRQYREANAKAA